MPRRLLVSLIAVAAGAALAPAVSAHVMTEQQARRHASWKLNVHILGDRLDESELRTCRRATQHRFNCSGVLWNTEREDDGRQAFCTAIIAVFFRRSVDATQNVERVGSGQVRRQRCGAMRDPEQLANESG